MEDTKNSNANMGQTLALGYVLAIPAILLIALGSSCYNACSNVWQKERNRPKVEVSKTIDSKVMTIPQVNFPKNCEEISGEDYWYTKKDGKAYLETCMMVDGKPIIFTCIKSR